MSYSIINLTKQLIRCPSISPKDAGCQDIIIKCLENIGFSIQEINIQDTKNFWAWHGHGKTLVFSGHTDVVHPGNINKWRTDPFDPVVHNNIIFGRGVSDMKGALAAMVVAAQKFVKSYPKHKGRLAFLITSDEEKTGKNGTKKVIKKLIKKKECIHYCLVGEPTSKDFIGDIIKNGRRGSLTAKLNIYGIQGHIAYPELIKNPITQAVKFANKLIVKQWDQNNNFFSKTNVEIIKVKSLAKSDNMNPDTCFLQFNFRFGTTLTSKIIQNCVEKFLTEENIKYNIKWQLMAQPFITMPGILLNSISDSIKYFNNIEPQLKTDGGTSDGRFFSEIGAEVIELGLINKTIHKTNECAKIHDLELLSNMYEMIIKKMFL